MESKTFPSHYSLKGIKPNSQPVRKKIEKNTHQRKTITRTRQYLRGSTIYLHPQSCMDITIIKEEYKVQHSATIFYLCIKTRQPHHTKKP